MPEYTPVYVVTGFLDSGKTSLLNQLLSRRLESGHSLCCIQFEQGEQALEQDLIDRGNLDLLHFPVRKLQGLCYPAKIRFGFWKRRQRKRMILKSLIS